MGLAASLPKLRRLCALLVGSILTSGCAVDVRGVPGQRLDMGVDAGLQDFGPGDQGLSDSGMPDLVEVAPDMASEPDSGPFDAGPPDLGCASDDPCNGRDDDCDGSVDESPGAERGENSCEFCTRTVAPAGSTYQFCRAGVSWAEAVTRCRALGYELLAIESADEDAFIDASLASRDWWMGLNDLDSADSYEWERLPDDVPLGTFHDWAADEPLTGSMRGEDCARIHEPSRTWRLYPCDGVQTFICEAVAGR